MLDTLTARLASTATAGRVLLGSGIIRPYPPSVLLGLLGTLRRWGTGPGGGFASVALRAPDRVAIIDERGSLTYGELHRRTNALARGLRELGVGEGDSVALMCRNHRGFVEATIAVNRLGADVLYLNTAFAGPQLLEVLEREEPRVVIHDEEFAGLLGDDAAGTPVVAWSDSRPAPRGSG